MKRVTLLLVVSAFSTQIFADEIHTPKDPENRNGVFNICPTDSILTYLMALDIEGYRNKPVDSFLLALPANYIKRKVTGGGRPKYAEALVVVYPNNVVVSIVVSRFTHMNRRSNTLEWDINLFKLEEIDHIEIYAGPECLKGCQ